MDKSIIAKKILTFIKSSLIKDNYDLDIDEINIDTDLGLYGVESIKLMTLLSEIEEEFKLTLKLEKLEEFEFKISAISIAKSLDE